MHTMKYVQTHVRRISLCKEQWHCVESGSRKDGRQDTLTLLRWALCGKTLECNLKMGEPIASRSRRAFASPVTARILVKLPWPQPERGGLEVFIHLRTACVRRM